MRKLLLTLLGLTIFGFSYSQCLLVEIPLSQRVSNANAIIEGEVISKHSFWNQQQSLIHTAYKIKAYKVFKGTLIGQEFEVITEGGRVGMDWHKVEPSLEMHVGHTGTFFLKPSTVLNSPNTSIPVNAKFMTYSGPQGFIFYDLKEETATDPFKKYSNIQNDLYAVITAQLGSSYQTKSGFDIEDHNFTFPEAITSMSPTTVTAGTYTVLTINGTGFGSSYTGSADVEFRNANDGGASYISAMASQIVSWSSTKVEVEVPSGAGTGTVRVTSSTGSVSTSSGTITVSYNQTNVTSGGNAYRPSQVRNNATGGLTYQFNTSFHSNTAAVESFVRALETWRCGIYVRFDTSQVLTSTACENGSDGVNVVTFDNSCLLSSGVLGTSYSYYQGCGSPLKWYLNANDIKFDASQNWNYGPAATSGGKYDFESVAVHELGHSVQLGHVINTTIVMHYSIGPNSDKRGLNAASDVAGGSEIITRSSGFSSCGKIGMTPLTSGTCAFQGPDANFTATPLSGCAPLNVTFTDQSTGSPFSWSWDFQNDGTPDDTTQNPTFTYTTPGSYTVRLTATNSAGTTSNTKAAFIVVHPNPSVSAGPDTSNCTGDSVRIGGSPTATGGSPGYTYTWTPSSTIGQPNASNPNVAPNSNTTFKVVVIDSNGCKDSATVDVNPNTSPTANAGGNQTNCQGDSTTLGGSPTASSGASPYTYLWNPAAAMNNNALANPKVAPSNSLTYTVTVTDTNGCTGVDAATITVVTPPTADAGFDQVSCNGQPKSIGGSPSATGGSGNYNYLWSPSTELNANFLPNPTCTPTQSRSYTLEVTDAVTSCKAYDTVEVTYENLPNVSAGADTSICPGDCAQLNASGAFTYTWTPANLVSNPNIANPVACLTADTFLVVTGATANGCENKDTIYISIKPQPTANAGSDANTCPGLPYQIISSGGGSYAWSPGHLLNDSTIFNPQASITITTSFTLTVTNAQLCSDSDTITLTAVPSVVADAGADKSVCPAGSATIGGSPTASNGSPGYTYSWTPNTDLNAANIANPISSPTANRTYFLEVTDNSGCKDYDTVNVTITTPVPFTVTNDTTYCESTCMQLNVTGTGSITWSPSTGLSSTTVANPTACPPGTITYTVIVTDGNSCQDSSTVTLTELQNPTISTNGNQLICAGECVELIATGGVIYSWTPTAGFSDPNNDTTSYCPTSTTQVTVQGTDINGCKDVSMVTVTVSPNPIADAGQNDTICSGTCLTLGGNPTASGGAGGPYTYSWQPTTGINNPTNSRPTACPTTTTWYTVIVSDAFNCLAKDSVSVQVLNTPVVNASNDITICGGNCTIISAQGASTYQWSPTTGLSNPNGASTNACPSFTTTYTVQGTNGGICSGIDSVKVTVIPKPNGTINQVGPFCETEPDQTLTAATSGGTWSGPGIINASTGEFRPSSAGVGTHKIYYSLSIGGCSSLDSTQIVIGSKPTATAGPDISICDGDTAFLSTGTGGTYKWEPNISLSCNTCQNTTATPALTTEYTVTVENPGCKAKDTVLVTVKQNPQLSAGATPSILCQGECATVFVSGASTYQWEPIGQVNPPNDTAGITCPTNNTTYTVTGTGQNGCSSEAVMAITVVPNPTSPTINNVGDSMFVSNTFATYQWFYNGVSIPAATNFYYVAPQSGTYRVEVTDQNGCGAVSNNKNMIVTGINELFALSHVKIFPNPITNFFIMEFRSRESDEFYTEIYDVSGQRVYTNRHHATQGYSKVRVDLPELSNGIYFIRISNGEETKSVQVVKN